MFMRNNVCPKVELAAGDLYKYRWSKIRNRCTYVYVFAQLDHEGILKATVSQRKLDKECFVYIVGNL